MIPENTLDKDQLRFSTCFNTLQGFCENILSTDPRFKALEMVAYTTPRCIDPSNPEDKVICPTIDSVDAQFQTLVTTDGKFDKAKYDSLKDRAINAGFLCYSDGIKVQVINSLNTATTNYGDL